MKKYAKKTYRQRLETGIVRQLLASPSQVCKGETIAEGLERARLIQERIVREASEHLAASPLTRMVAESLARAERRRGSAVITIDADGGVFLEIRYGDSGSTPEPGQQPALTKLRELAAALGIDVSDLGRSKKKIMERIVLSQQSKQENRPMGMNKTGVSITPPRVLDEEDFDSLFGVTKPASETPPVEEDIEAPAEEMVAEEQVEEVLVTPPPKEVELAPVKRKGLSSLIFQRAATTDLDAIMAPNKP